MSCGRYEEYGGEDGGWDEEQARSGERRDEMMQMRNRRPPRWAVPIKGSQPLPALNPPVSAPSPSSSSHPPSSLLPSYSLSSQVFCQTLSSTSFVSFTFFFVDFFLARHASGTPLSHRDPPRFFRLQAFSMAILPFHPGLSYDIPHPNDVWRCLM